MIDTIIFDADGVVVDSESVWDQCMSEFLRIRGCVYDRSRFKHILGGRSAVDGVLILQEAYGFDGDVEDLVRERLSIAKNFFGSNGLNYIHGFQNFYKMVRNNYKTCIATSMDRELLEIADKKLRIISLFQGNVFTVADVGYASKPKSDLFLYSATKLGSRPASCVVIEDSPNGIEAAKRAGMQCIALTTTYNREKLTEASSIVDSYSQIDMSQF